jgi:hypothetical protein
MAFQHHFQVTVFVWRNSNRGSEHPYAPGYQMLDRHGSGDAWEPTASGSTAHYRLPRDVAFGKMRAMVEGARIVCGELS